MIKFFGNEYGITSDERQWKIVQPYHDKKNNKWTNKPVSYHSTLHSAVEALFKLKIRTSDYESVKQLCDNIDKIRDEIVATVKQHVSMKIDI